MKQPDVKVSLIFALLCIVFVFHSAAQESTQRVMHLITNQQTKSLLTASINAMGGLTSWGLVSDATATGSCTAASAQGGTGQTYPFLWITQANEFRYDNDSTTHDPVMLSGHGKPSMVSSNGTRTLNYETATLMKPFHLPGQVLLMELNDQNYYAKIVGTETTEGVVATHVRIVRYLAFSVVQGTKQDWWLDPATNLPIKVTFLVPGQRAEAYLPLTYVYSGWTNQAQGLSVPQNLNMILDNNLLLQTCTQTLAEINSNPPAATFDER